MDIEEISQVLYKEKNQTLKTIPADFYLEAEKYIKELEAEIKKNSNPRAPESKMLNNELEQAISDLETIFMKRRSSPGQLISHMRTSQSQKILKSCFQPKKSFMTWYSGE